jgi:hypothetical protein
LSPSHTGHAIGLLKREDAFDGVDHLGTAVAEVRVGRAASGFGSWGRGASPRVPDLVTAVDSAPGLHLIVVSVAPSS